MVSDKDSLVKELKNEIDGLKKRIKELESMVKHLEEGKVIILTSLRSGYT